MAGSTIRESFTCFDAARSIGRMASSKKTAPRHSNIKGKKDRETERGAGEEKAWGK